MATPSGSRVADGRAPHNAATPQSQPHLPNFSSPAPRSVPSPAAHRQAGKSPFTAATHAHTVSSTTAQNHPTVGSSGSASKALLGSSPAAAMMSFESPLPMGFSLSQLGGAEGGVPMATGISGLGGLGLLPVGASEEEKARRLTEVIEKIKARSGAVTKNNIVALAARLGFDAFLGNNEITIAGRTVMVEVHLDSQNEIKKAEVSFPAEPSKTLQDTEASASAVFQDCLVASSGQPSITKKLDRFAANLEKLGKIDKPHGTAGDGFNGFEAISGIYSSLRKLYDYEREMAEQLWAMSDNKESKAEAEVTCKKSGRPRMNENGKIGLDLDYWIHRRHVHSLKRTGIKNDLFSVSILCEAMQPNQMTQPARISDAWISDQVMKSDDNAEGDAMRHVDWLDPASGIDQTSATASITQGKLPNVHFVAKLEPPLLIPGEAATQSGLLARSVYHHLPSYLAALLLHDNPLDAVNDNMQIPPRVFSADRMTVLERGRRTEKHTNVLRPRSYDQAVLLHDIAFDHPKQLIELLPILRQFAFLNTILRSSFPNAETSVKSLRTFYPGEAAGSSSIDFAFSSLPNPRLGLTFTRQRTIGTNAASASDNLDDFFADTSSTAIQPPLYMAVTIAQNADILVGENNIATKDSSDEDRKILKDKLARILDVAADLDVSVEFIKKQGHLAI